MIPKRIAQLLRPHGWSETRIRGNLVVIAEKQTSEGKLTSQTELKDYLDGHKIDFVKNRVAFDVE